MTLAPEALTSLRVALAERATENAALTSARLPRACPFLGDDQGCTIYPVRPLACAGYASIRREDCLAAASDPGRDVPLLAVPYRLTASIIQGFARAREGEMEVGELCLLVGRALGPEDP